MPRVSKQLQSPQRYQGEGLASRSRPDQRGPTSFLRDIGVWEGVYADWPRAPARRRYGDDGSGTTAARKLRPDAGMGGVSGGLVAGQVAAIPR